tara:strand:+ start:1429 stop:1890 length:462 start_codon:yes stop_codon:yes gene_type:complete
MARGTSRNRVHNGIRTRFLDQVSIAAFRPADLLTIETAEYLSLNNTFYGLKTSQSGSGTEVNSVGAINGISHVTFLNVNLATIPEAISDPGVVNRIEAYINGLFLEKSAIIDSYPKNVDNNLELKIDNSLASLENNLDSIDLITITGKLISTS